MTTEATEKQQKEFYPHSHDLSTHMLSLETAKLNARQRCVLSSIFQYVDPKTCWSSTWLKSLYADFVVRCERIGIRVPSMRTFQRIRTELVELGYITVKKRLNQRSLILVHIDKIKADFKRFWNKCLASAKKRFFNSAESVTHELKKAKRRLNHVTKAVSAKKHLVKSGTQLPSLTIKKENIFNTLASKFWLSKEVKSKLFSGEATQEEVLNARQVYKRYGWKWKFFQYDEQGRFQVTGKAAEQAIAERESQAKVWHEQNTQRNPKFLPELQSALDAEMEEVRNAKAQMQAMGAWSTPSYAKQTSDYNYQADYAAYETDTQVFEPVMQQEAFTEPVQAPLQTDAEQRTFGQKVKELVASGLSMLAAIKQANQLKAQGAL